ncbi:NmrA/HSCARG family protein [Kineococcus rhizosphaerae]|uniref:Uncharacterized protein YbjT (DUF2867 family) n=1 Tax=Kineococcus rhizosphaerae TaxID=559628 RepID=A0A2T0R3R0_9ACTN|nr:NmrA/HSCARG family protein [Kineococcus rhizosphaerae]PRY14651.1 uncharacterized protein YbjT (DUF2867 family) [Kineococcus rhizosphaerae]
MRLTVLGATGGQGGAVVRALRGRGHALRALVRDPGSDRSRRLAAGGVDLVPGDLDDVASLRAAMTGADAVFAVTTPFEDGPEAEIAQGRTVIAAATAAAVPHLVLSSVASATAGTGVPHFETKAVIEAELAASAVPHTVLAPAYFMENLLGGLEDVRRGLLLLPLPVDRPLQQLARDDFGRYAAHVLTGPAGTGRRVELASDAPTPRRMAQALGASLGVEVRAEELPLPDDLDGDMPAMWRFLRGHGYAVDLGALHADGVLDRWTSFADWARTLPGAVI